MTLKQACEAIHWHPADLHLGKIMDFETNQMTNRLAIPCRSWKIGSWNFNTMFLTISLRNFPRSFRNFFNLLRKLNSKPDLVNQKWQKRILLQKSSKLCLDYVENSSEEKSFFCELCNRKVLPRLDSLSKNILRKIGNWVFGWEI